MTKSYNLSQDLFVLASKAFNSGDVKTASRFFVYACSTPDLDSFIAKASSDNHLEHTVEYNQLRAHSRVLASVEEELNSDGPLSTEELSKMLSRLKVLSSDETTDEEEDFGLDIDEEAECAEKEANTCKECEQDPCMCEFASESFEEELSSSIPNNDLLERVKNGLVSLKVRSNDWEVKKFMPILITFFPNLSVPESNREICETVNIILNSLRSIDSTKLRKLDNSITRFTSGEY